MKILMNIMKYDYGDKSRGYSYEYDNYYKSLIELGFDADIFDFITISQSKGNSVMNQELLKAIKKKNYDIVFSSLSSDEFSPEFMNKLKNKSNKSIVWMNDDQWRWKSLGKKMCFSFHNVITTDPDAIQKYRKIGYQNAILSQFACNTNIFKRNNSIKDIDVSFIGQPNPWRNFVIDYLRKKGINVHCFGFGWPNGRVSTKEMIDIFNRSKINLNLSNSVQYNLEYLTTINPSWNKKKSLIRNIYGIFGPQLNTLLSPKREEQIKARIFEITGSGGFTLTYGVKHLSKYFNLSDEISTYSSIDDLVNKTRYYLLHDKERETIAVSGYKKTLLEHTYKNRFEAILSQLYPPV